MTLSDFRRITDELLSAYIDDEVTEQERALVEAAIAADDEIAWRLNSLRQTVTLLRNLPELALPRSFTFTLDPVRMDQADEQIAGVGATEQQPVAWPMAPPRLRPAAMPAPQVNSGFWEQVQEGWRRFWQGGNPMLRNAAAVSFALMLLITGGGQILTRALTQPVGMMATAPEAAPASSEAVALAPTATESLQTETEPAASKAPGEESSPLMQSQAAPANETAEASAQASDAASTENPAGNTATTMESAAGAGEATANSTPADNYAVQEEEEAAVAEAADASAAPASDSAQEEPAAAAMAAPAAPPFPNGPRPQSGGGDGLGMGGAEVLPPGMGGGEADFPPQAYGFDTNPVGGPTVFPAEEAVSASVAAAPAAEAPAESVADVAVTPAVDAPVAEMAAASTPSEAATTEVTADASARSAAPVTEPVTDSSAVSVAVSVAISGPTTGQVVVEAPVVELTGEPSTESTITPTPEEVALAAPELITSSEVIEDVTGDGTVTATNLAVNLPVVWVAQGTVVLLTLMLTSLWWRSRTPRRPRQQ